MNYIKVPKNIVIDYIPEDFNLCDKCLYNGICPWEYECPTAIRTTDAERKVSE